MFYKNKLVKIFNEDILRFSLEENSVDLIITSPPYNLDISYGNYNDSGSYIDYLYFSEQWLSKCFNLAKDDGRICINVPLDKNKNGHQSISADIANVAKKVGWQYQSTIVWNKQNITKRTAWGSWMSASSPNINSPIEVILVLYKKVWKKISGSLISDITRDEFISWTTGVWDIKCESKKKIGHPAPFSTELPRRCMKLFSYVQDIILDPFNGSGSTLIACQENRRKGIGIDIDSTYCQLAKDRIIDNQNNQENFLFDLS